MFILNLNSQNKGENLNLSNNSNAIFNVQKIVINDSGPDLCNYEINLGRISERVFKCSLIDINNNQFWTKETLTSLTFVFEVTSNNRLKLLVDTTEITKVLKSDVLYKQFEKIESLGEYKQLLHNQEFVFGLHFEEYLQIIMDVLYSDVIDYTKEVKLQNMSDTITGIESMKVLKDKNLLKLTKIVTIDEERVKDELFAKKADVYKNIKIDRDDMPVVVQTKETKVIANKINDEYIIECIDYDSNYNLGNDFDRYFFYRIQRKNKAN